MTQKLIPYGVANYAEIVRDNHYFVDKTQYIARLERVKNSVFLRPRRFGKSLHCEVLMTRASRTKSRMMGNYHVRFGSGGG